MFAEDLRAKLKENHMPQKELAKYLGVAGGTVSWWCTGRSNPRSREFNMICDLFEMSREKYTAERNGIKTAEFHPKPIVDPEVKEKQSEWKNPYVKEEPSELEQKVDGLIDLTNTHGQIIYALDEAVHNNDKDAIIEKLRCQLSAKDREIGRLQGVIEGIKLGAQIDDDKINRIAEEEPKKSWWKRLWE